MKIHSAICSIVMIAVVAGCGGQVRYDQYATKGWIDNNTYYITAAGVPNSKLVTKIERRDSAKRASILNAQYQISEEFRGETIAGNSVDFSRVDAILTGSVMSATYDEEDNCEINYQIQCTGFRGDVKAGSGKCLKMRDSTVVANTPINQSKIVSSGGFDTANLKKIGVVGAVSRSSKEITVNSASAGKDIHMGDKLFLLIDNQKIEMTVVFPMLTVAKCRIDKQFYDQLNKIKKEMPVYK